MYRLVPSPAGTERIAQILILLLACSFGTDYLIEPPKATLYTTEQLIGGLLPLWGAAFLTLGIMGLLGELWMAIGHAKEPSENPVGYICTARNRWWPSFTAHVGLCGMYAGIGFGCIAEMIVHGHLYGMRVVGGMFMLVVGHCFFAQKRRHVF